MELLEVNHLCKTYGSGETAVHALKDVSFSVPKGEYVAVVGESGSGKSTLLNLIGGLDTPTSGKVLIDGKDVFAMKDRERTIFRRRNIGFIFQAFNLIPELTVEQNILFPVLLDYQKPDRAYLEELLTVLNLKDRRKHLPSQLSGGQQQRVAIGRALMTRPSLILADEPTGNLDTQNTSEVIALLKETSRKYEQTILMITLNLPKIPGGKKLIYTLLTMPLIALTDLRAKGEQDNDPRYTALADIVDAHNGLWCPEAEEYLLANFNPED